ncbi:MAG: tetratricopeptide repeat protein [Gammaproteobacteria bacterium]|nr:tetratricopeptide repeat protein [Gammaproteobacteria bacterium]
MPRISLLLFIIALPLYAWGNSLSQMQTELKNGRYQQAIDIGQALLANQADDTQVLFLTALALQKNQQLDQAQIYYQQIMQLHPDLPEPRNNLAIIFLQKGKHDQAVDLLIESLNTHPAYATAWQNLSNLYKGLASEAYRKALSEDNNASSVIDSIQLSELTRIHSLPEPVITITRIPSPPVATASVEVEPPTVTASQPAPAQPQDTQQIEQTLIQTVKDWADHWSSKNFDAYIDAYTDSYKGKLISHRAWVEYRRPRILRPGLLQVDLANIQIKSRNANRAIIDFDQSYQSATYRDKIRKRINLILTDEGWKISRERTLAVL